MWTYPPLAYGGWHGMGWMLGANLVLWLLVIVALPLFCRRLVRDGSSEAGSALELLQNRYARGEIGRQEYLEKMQDLLDKG